MLVAVLALDAADKTVLGVLAPELKRQFAIGNGEIGLLASVFVVVGGIATVPIGVLTDRTRRITLLVVSIGIWSVRDGSCRGCDHLRRAVRRARASLGVLTAACGPPVTSVIGDLFSPDVRGRIISWVKSGELVGAAAGFVVTGVLVSFFSWRSAFVVLGLFGVLAAFRVAGVEEPRRGGEDFAGDAGESGDEPSQIQELVAADGAMPKEDLVLDGDKSDMSLPSALGYVLRVRTLAMVILATAFGEFFFTALQVFGVLLLVEQFDLSVSTAALIIPLVGVAGFVGVLGGGRIGDRLIENGTLTGRILVGEWSYLAVALLFLPVLATSSLAVALPFLALAGVFLMAPIAPLEAARLDVVHPQLRGRAESVRTMARVAAQATAPLAFGLLSDSLAGGGADGMRAAFLAFLPLLGLSSALLVAAAREYPSEVASVEASSIEGPDGAPPG